MIVSSVNKCNFSFFDLCVFYLFALPFCSSWDSSTILNRSDGSRLFLCWVLDHLSPSSKISLVQQSHPTGQETQRIIQISSLLGTLTRVKVSGINNLFVIFEQFLCHANQPSLSLPSLSPAFNLSQHQGLSQWVNTSHQVAKGLGFQLQHQPFQWVLGLISFRMDWLDLLAVQGTLKSLL